MSAIDAVVADYEAVRGGCGLVDRSARGKLALSGAGAAEFLNGQVSNDVVGLTPGTGCYAAFLTPKGKMLGDLRILHAGEELLLDTERVALQELFNMIRRFSIGYAVELHKRTLESGLLSLIGPGSDQVLGPLVPEAEEHAHRLVSLDGVPARTIRTDLGIDVLFDAGAGEAVRAELLARGAVPVSEEVAEIRRVESGRPRFGIDLDDTVIPQEAGLNERAVSFTKGCYVGQETVARLYYRGKPNRRLAGLRLGEGVLPERGAEIVFEGRAVGHLGSVCRSPALGALALALVRREAPDGAEVRLGPEGLAARVEPLPFAPAGP